MSVCRRCQKDDAGKHGYCSECYEQALEEIRHHMGVLVRLSDEASPYLNEKQHNQVLAEMRESYSTLAQYKAQHILKSDISTLCELIERNLDEDVHKPVWRNIYMLGSLIAQVLFLALYFALALYPFSAGTFTMPTLMMLPLLAKPATAALIPAGMLFAAISYGKKARWAALATVLCIFFHVCLCPDYAMYAATGFVLALIGLYTTKDKLTECEKLYRNYPRAERTQPLFEA